MRVFQSIYEYRGAPGRWLPICAALTLAPIVALAQPAPSHHSHTASSSTGPDSEAVISIRYHCAPRSSKAGACAMAVTKQEFDALVRAIDPNMPASGRQALAAEYSRLLIMAAEARRRGLDQLPELQTLLKFSELQLLGARLVRDISGRASLVSPEEIEGYFRDHGRDYQEVTLSRIFVPAHPDGQSQHGSPAAERAEQAHTRAINGENFSTLQREIKEASPTVSLGPMPCRSLQKRTVKSATLQLVKYQTLSPTNRGTLFTGSKRSANANWTMYVMRFEPHWSANTSRKKFRRCAILLPWNLTRVTLENFRRPILPASTACTSRMPGPQFHPTKRRRISTSPWYLFDEQFIACLLFLN